MTRTSLCRHAGFSLTEQIMVLLVLAILAIFAVPPLHQFLRNHRLQAAQLDYIGALRYARSIAATRGTKVIVCPSADGKRCNGGNRWNGGWLIGLDPDAKGQPDGDPLYVGGRDTAQLNVVGSGDKKLLRFQPDGSAGGTNQTMVLCLRGDSHKALLVIVSRYGRIRGNVASPEQTADCAAVS